MKRFLGIIAIILILVGLCITDELLVNKTLHQINYFGQELYSLGEQASNLNSEQILTKANDLFDYWQGREAILSFFTNHKDIRDMGIEITKIISYAKSNLKEEFNASLELVIYYTNSFHQVMGISLQNIF